MRKKEDKKMKDLEKQLKKEIMDIVGFGKKEASRFARAAAIAHRDLSTFKTSNN